LNSSDGQAEEAENRSGSGSSLDRRVIDMAANTGELLTPLSYHTIARVEDRLYIPAEFVPLFEDKGWRRWGRLGGRTLIEAVGVLVDKARTTQRRRVSNGE
jgi:hypothetical protein